MYDLLKTIHVLAAAAWFGGALMLLVLEGAVYRAAGPGPTAALAGRAAKASTALFMPASIVVLLSGIGTVLVGGIGFEQPWILAGLLGVVGGAITGARFLAPLNTQIAEVADAPEVDVARLDALRVRLRAVSLADVAILVVVIALMVWKPTS